MIRFVQIFFSLFGLGRSIVLMEEEDKSLREGVENKSLASLKQKLISLACARRGST